MDNEEQGGPPDAGIEPESDSVSAEATLPLLRRPPVRVGLFLLLILAAYIVPRAWAYRGIDIVTNFTFADQIYHNFHMDVMGKRQALGKATLDDPYLKHFPELTMRIHPYRWPGAVYYVALPWAMLFGSMSIWTTQITNFIFFLVLVAGIVGLGHAMGSLRLGLWAALLTALCPPLIASSWYFSLDSPALVAMTVTGLFLLLRTRGFSRFFPTILFSMWSGLGIYVKFSYAIYLLVPCVAAFAWGMWARRRSWVLLNAAIAWGIGCGMFLLAFDASFEEIWGEFVNHFGPSDLPAAAIPVFSKYWFLSQPTFAALNFPYPLLILAAPGFLFIHLWPRQPAVRWLLLAYFWGSVVLLTIMSNKLERYLHPIYPLLCLFCVWWVVHLLRGRLRILAAGIIALAFAGMAAYLQVHPTPWHTGKDNARASAAMWNEYSMPGNKRLNAQRQDPYYSVCHYKEMMEQILSWARKDPHARPLGLAHVRSVGDNNREIPFGELLLLVAHHLPDRFVVAGGLYGMERLPGPLGQSPTLIIIHPPDEPPEKVHKDITRVLERKTFKLRCDKANPSFTLSLYKHL